MGAELADEALELGATVALLRLAQRHHAVDEGLHESLARSGNKKKSYEINL